MFAEHRRQQLGERRRRSWPPADASARRAARARMRRRQAADQLFGEARARSAPALIAPPSVAADRRQLAAATLRTPRLPLRGRVFERGAALPAIPGGCRPLAAAWRSRAVRTRRPPVPRCSAVAQRRRGVGMRAQAGQRLDDGFVLRRHGAARRACWSARGTAAESVCGSRSDDQLARPRCRASRRSAAQRALEHGVGLRACRSARWRGSASCCTCGSASLEHRASARAARRCRRTRAADRRRCGARRGWWSSSAARRRCRPAAPKPISSSRSRRMVWTWSSVASASASGRTIARPDRLAQPR